MRHNGNRPVMDNRIPPLGVAMSHRLIAILVLTWVLMLLPAGCSMPEGQNETPVPTPVEPPVAEPEPERSPEAPTAVVEQNANVRTGPGTGHAVAYWLHAGDTVTVTGRNADSTWLQIEHRDRPGWISATLIDIATEGMAALPADTPPETAAAEPAQPEAAPEPEPAPEIEVQAPAHTVATATVTGTVVNLRRGPGTDHPIDGQVRAGDRLTVLGRNDDGGWLQVMHPVATGELVWIFAALTDIDAETVQALADATAVVVEVATAPAPAVEPQPAATSEPAVEDVIPDCTQWHTVNPNETRLSQITDWFGLDLQLVETINRFSDTERLEAGMLLCLRTSGIDTALAPATEPEVAIEVPDAEPETPPATTSSPAPAPPAGCPTCPSLPDFPERGHPNAPIGQKVVDSPLGVLWHAPGSYSRDLPGLDHDFELVFTDNSIMWDWSVRDFQACYDAVRVHMGEVSREANLQRLEVQLHDPDYFDGIPGWAWGYRDYATEYQSPWTNGRGMPYEAYPNWDPTHPDVGRASLDCDYSPSTGQLLCDIVPAWGNSHSIHLNAAATLALANTIAAASDNARAYRHNRLDQRIIDFNAYLFPILDNNRGDPAGQGPCLDVARAR